MTNRGEIWQKKVADVGKPRVEHSKDATAGGYRSPGAPPFQFIPEVIRWEAKLDSSEWCVVVS